MQKISIITLLPEEQIQYQKKGFAIRVVDGQYGDIFFKPHKYDIAGDDIGYYPKAGLEKQQQGLVLKEPYLLWSLLLSGIHPDVLQYLLQSHHELAQYVDLKRELQSWSAHERLQQLPASPLPHWDSVVSLTMLAYCIIHKKIRYAQVLHMHGASLDSTVSIPKEITNALLSHVQANPYHMEELAKESQLGWCEHASTEYITCDNQLIRKTDFTMSVFGDQGVEEAEITADILYAGQNASPDLNRLIMREKENEQQRWMRKSHAKIVVWQRGVLITEDRYVLHESVLPSVIAVTNKAGEWVTIQNITRLAYDMARDELLVLTSVTRQEEPSLEPFKDMPWVGCKDESNKSCPYWKRQVYAERQADKKKKGAFVAVEEVDQKARITTKRLSFFAKIATEVGANACSAKHPESTRRPVFLSEGGRTYSSDGGMSVSETQRWSVTVEEITEVVMDCDGKRIKIRDKNELRMMLCYGVKWLTTPYKGLSCSELIEEVGLFHQGKQAYEGEVSYTRGSDNGAAVKNSAGFSPCFFRDSLETSEPQENRSKEKTEGEKIAAIPRGVR